MPHKVSKRDLQKADRLFHQLMFRVAIGETDQADLRTINIMYKHGIGGDNKKEPALEMVDLLASEQHPKRLSVPLGPLVVYRDSGNGSRITVSPVADLLFKPRQEVRTAAISYFETMCGRAVEKCLTPGTEMTISGMKGLAVSDDPSKWRSAALRVYDAIKDDWLCNLAGLRQCLALDFRDAIPEFLTPVLRPTVSSLDSISPAVWNPSTQQKQVLDTILKIVEDADDLVHAIDRYYQDFGCLPLCESLALGRVLREWTRRNETTENLWNVLWDWANGKKSPLPRYHLCQLFLEHFDLVPKNETVKLWEEIAEVVDLKAGRSWTEAWYLRCELARHYSAHLECRAPWQDGERIAVLAWWLAEQVAMLFGSLSSAISKVREHTMVTELALSMRVRQIAHPVVKGSAFRCGTLYVPSIWRLALLSEVGRNLAKLGHGLVPDSQREWVRKALVGEVLGLFPMKPKQSGQEAYAFDQTVIPSAQSWLSIPDEEKEAVVLQVLTDATLKLRDTDLGTVLDNALKSHKADQMLAASAVNVLAYTGELSADTVWERISSEAWWKVVLLNWEERTLDVMFDALTEIQVQNGAKWAYSLPHIFASACEAAQRCSDRQKLLFGYTVLCSVSTDTVSAIQRLLRGSERECFAEEVRTWRKHFQEIQAASGSWVASRLRAVLAALYIG